MAPEEAGTMKGSGDGVDTWRYPYLASLNSAQLQGKFVEDYCVPSTITHSNIL